MSDGPPKSHLKTRGELATFVVIAVLLLALLGLVTITPIAMDIGEYWQALRLHGH